MLGKSLQFWETQAAPSSSHLSPHSVIVQPHAGMNVPVGLAGIQEVPRELLAEFHIRTAAAPLPGVLGARQVRGEVLHDAVYHALPPVDGLQLQAVQFDAKGFLVAAPLLVAAARLEFAHGAGVGHGVHDARCCDGIREGTLSETCGAEGHDSRVTTHVEVEGGKKSLRQEKAGAGFTMTGATHKI